MFSFHLINYLRFRLNQSKVMGISNAIVLNLCQITEQRKKQLKVEILHNLLDVLKQIFKFYFVPDMILCKICYLFKNIILTNNLEKGCQFA